MLTKKIAQKLVIQSIVFSVCLATGLISKAFATSESCGSNTGADLIYNFQGRLDTIISGKQKAEFVFGADAKPQRSLDVTIYRLINDTKSGKQWAKVRKVHYSSTGALRSLTKYSSQGAKTYSFPENFLFFMPRKNGYVGFRDQGQGVTSIEDPVHLGNPCFSFAGSAYPIEVSVAGQSQTGSEVSTPNGG